MIRNYFKTAWRNLCRHGTLAVINGTGLAVALAFVLLVSAFGWIEFRVNADIKDNDRIFLLRSKWTNENLGYDFTSLAPLGKALRDNYPQLVAAYYHHDDISSYVSHGEKKFSERLQPGDSSFLTLFGFPLLYGDPQQALSGPSSVVITEAKATKYFGRTNVVGETLTIRSFLGSRADFVITGVLRDLPRNTVNNITGPDLPGPEIFFSASSLRFFGRDAGFDSWHNPFIINYVKLQPGVQPDQLREPLRQLLRTHTALYTQKNLEVFLTPLSQYYLQSAGGLPGKIILVLSAVVLFMLVMAVINFVNISLGNSIGRLREIGVRKVIGSSRWQLVGQFLSDAVLLTVASLLAALVIYHFSRPLVAGVLNRPIPPLTGFPALFYGAVLVLVLVIGLLGGLYPAFILSNQSTLTAIRGKMQGVNQKMVVRRILLCTQYAASIIVFVAAIFITRQLNFVFNGDLGYSKEGVVTALVPRDWTAQGVKHIDMVRDRMEQLPGVESVSCSFDMPNGSSGNNNLLYRPGQDSTQGVVATTVVCDEHFAGTYRIRLAAGDFFSRQGSMPVPDGLVLNEVAARSLGWKTAADAVGQSVRVQGNPTPMVVTGVTHDFHLGSFQQQITPVVFQQLGNVPLFRMLSFRLKPGNLSGTLAAIQQQWVLYFPDAPFEYVFLDDTLRNLYRTEIRMKQAFSAATMVALLIVLLGVFGMASLNIARRTKEMGVRKVLGARSGQIILLFLREFSGVLVLANLIAWPLVYYFLHRWLLNYAYRISLDWKPFLLAGIILFALVTLIVAVLSSRLAATKVVRSLRTE